jgi:transposase
VASIGGSNGHGARKRHQVSSETGLTWLSLVVETGVDPVTYRFSGGRSAN